MPNQTPPLSLKVLALIDDLFPEDMRDHVRQALAEAAGYLEISENEYDRCRIAVLKLSEGDRAQFDRALALFEIDYRDVLMDAGFGYDVRAHLTWRPEAPQGD